MKSANVKEIDAEFGALLQYHRKRTFDPQRGGYLTQARLAEQEQDERQPLTVVFSVQSIYEWFDALFRWSEADAYARSSWAGMAIWTLSALGDRASALRWFRLFGFLTLWGLASWLAAPILQWPLADPEKRVRAAMLFAAASIVLPLAIALWSPSDAPADQSKATSRQRQTTSLLQLAGAAVGFNSVAAMLLFLAVGYFYLGGTVAVWGLRIGLMAPLLMAHVGARRIPSDRHKMYGGTVRLHPADLPFLITFLLAGAALGAFVTIGYDILASKATGAGILGVAAGLALWHRHLRWRFG